MDVARKLGSPVTVVKAQIHAGGRGKGRFKDDPNGRRRAVSKSIDEVGANAAAMLGHDLVTSRPDRPAGPSSGSISRKAATSSAAVSLAAG